MANMTRFFNEYNLKKNKNEFMTMKKHEKTQDLLLGINFLIHPVCMLQSSEILKSVGSV